MERLGVAHHFDAVFDIIAAEYVSKPDPAAYRALIGRHGLTPRATALFEDLSRNLAPAAELGMTTVWVRNATVWSESPSESPLPADCIHHETDDLVAWLEAVIAARRPKSEPAALTAPASSPMF